MSRFGPVLGLALLAVPVAASAGPPFLIDDPEPTEVGHWEIYAPLFQADGSGDEFDGALETEINYGAAPDLQLTLGLPVAYTHDARGGAGGRAISKPRRNTASITTKRPECKSPPSPA